MSARVYFMKMVKDCKDVSLYLRKMNSEDGQVYSVFILQFSFFTKYNRMQSNLQITAFSVGITILNQRII